MLDLLEDMLNDEGLGYARLDGKMEQRKREDNIADMRDDSEKRAFLVGQKAPVHCFWGNAVLLYWHLSIINGLPLNGHFQIDLCRSNNNELKRDKVCIRCRCP